MATILVIDDEAIVLTVVGMVLERAGHTVIEAKAADEGLSAANRLQRIDVLIVNHLLHGVRGRELAEIILTTHPRAKVLHISGHLLETLIEEGNFTPGAAFLQEPFLPKALEEKVRELLM